MRDKEASCQCIFEFIRALILDARIKFLKFLSYRFIGMILFESLILAQSERWRHA